MLLSVCLSILLVSTLSMSMPMDVKNEDIIQRSPRESYPDPASAKELEKEEAVLLEGALLNELDKELKEQKAVKSREADEDGLNEEDRSLDEEEEEEREVEDEDPTAAELEERKAKGFRAKLLRRLKKKFTKVGSNKKVMSYSGVGGYARALKYFNRFRPKSITKNKGKLNGKFRKGRITLKLKGKSNRPTLKIVRKGSVYKFMF